MVGGMVSAQFPVGESGLVGCGAGEQQLPVSLDGAVGVARSHERVSASESRFSGTGSHGIFLQHPAVGRGGLDVISG